VQHDAGRDVAGVGCPGEDVGRRRVRGVRCVWDLWDLWDLWVANPGANPGADSGNNSLGDEAIDYFNEATKLVYHEGADPSAHTLEHEGANSRAHAGSGSGTCQ